MPVAAAASLPSSFTSIKALCATYTEIIDRVQYSEVPSLEGGVIMEGSVNLFSNCASPEGHVRIIIFITIL